MVKSSSSATPLVKITSVFWDRSCAPLARRRDLSLRFNLITRTICPHVHDFVCIFLWQQPTHPMLRRHHLPVRSVEALREKQSGAPLEKSCRPRDTPRENYAHVARSVTRIAGDSIAISKRGYRSRQIREVPNHWSSESRLFSTPRREHARDAAWKRSAMR